MTSYHHILTQKYLKKQGNHTIIHIEGLYHTHDIYTYMYRCLSAIDLLVLCEVHRATLDSLIPTMKDICTGLSLKSDIVKLYVLTALQRVVEEKKHISKDMYLCILEDVIFPVVSRVRELEAARRKEGKGGRTRLHLNTVKLLSKILLRAMPYISRDDSFPILWDTIVTEIEYIVKVTDGTAFGGDRVLVETGCEIFKNMLLVMVNTCTWTEDECVGDVQDDVWNPTWARVKVFNAGLYNEVIVLLKAHFANMHKQEAPATVSNDI